jgi:hypothetical protein
MRMAMALLLSSAACSSAELLPAGDAVLDPGHEPDVWTIEPLALEARVDRVFEDGTRKLHATPTPPFERFSLGRGTPAIYDLSAMDADGVARVRARSLPVDPAGFAGWTLPLFVARTETFARPPGELVHAHGDNPPSVVVGGRFLFVAGAPDGARILADAYDVGGWDALPDTGALECPVDPCRVRSLAVVDGTLVLAVGDGWARWYDVYSTGIFEPALPETLSGWNDVAGGHTVVAPDGTAYIVGATRSETATDAVLVAGSTGTLDVIRLVGPRVGAAATWVEGRGLVVAGGSDTAAGVELLAEGSQAFVPLPHAPDSTHGAALVPVDSSLLLRVGGRDAAAAYAASAELDLACGTGCAANPRADVIELDAVQAVEMEGRSVVAGSAPDGMTAAFAVTQTESLPLPLREPRRNATLLLSPTGHAALVGGTRTDGTSVTTIELFLP